MGQSEVQRVDSASSVDRLFCAQTVRGPGWRVLMYCIMSSSKYFTVIGVRATGRRSFIQAGLGTGMMVALLRQVDTLHWLGEMMNTSVKTSFNCSAQSLRT